MFLDFITKTDVAKHENVTQKHLKSASHTVRSVSVHGMLIYFSWFTAYKKDKITALLDRPFYERSILCFAHVSFSPNSLFPTSANRHFRNFST